MKQTLPSEMEVTPREKYIIENPQLPSIDFGMILQATENLSTKIGRGGFGVVYKVEFLNHLRRNITWKNKTYNFTIDNWWQRRLSNGKKLQRKNC